MSIPKKIHLSWNNKELLSDDHDLVKLGVGRLAEMNPDWKIEVNTDEEIDNYLQKFLEDADYEIIKDRHVVQKSDLWRLMKLLFEGGLYTDVDRLCDVKLDSLLESNTTWVLPMCEDMNFSHDFMMSAPGNPVFYHAVHLYLERMRVYPDNVYLLGPQSYMHAVGWVLVNDSSIGDNPSQANLMKLRKSMDSHEGIVTYREELPYNTIIYRGGETDTDHEDMKRDFYAKSGITHWTGSW
tara:strand:+ start:4442 stop:5158 length:717 start_codon:yes stop_codon:yes gene_type:complete